jgi:hypothetical protein
MSSVHTFKPNLHFSSVSVEVRLGVFEQSAYSNILSLANGLCIDVNGKNTASGAFIDTWDCVSDYNEQFQYNASTLTFQEQSLDMCIATSPCTEPKIEGGVCQVTCDSNSPGQRWTINSTDLTIRLEADPTSCLTVASAEQANVAFMSECDPGNSSQQWTFPSQSGYVGTCIRMTESEDRERAAYCFNIFASGQYQLVTATQVLSSGSLGTSDIVGNWHSIQLTAVGDLVSASVNGTLIASVQDQTYASGLTCVQSGWGVAYFDNFVVS